MKQLVDCQIVSQISPHFLIIGQTQRLSGLIKCYSVDGTSAAMEAAIELCQSCSEETKYRCLRCQKPTCNRSTNCSIAASEELSGWNELSILEDNELPAGEQDREYDMESAPSSIKTVREAMEFGDELRKFAEFNGHQELSLAMSRVNDLLSKIKLSSSQQQTKIDDYFSAV